MGIPHRTSLSKGNLASIISKVFNCDVFDTNGSLGIEFLCARKRVEGIRKSAKDCVALISEACPQGFTENGYVPSEKDRKADKFSFFHKNGWTNKEITYWVVFIEKNHLCCGEINQSELIPWEDFITKIIPPEFGLS